MAASTHASKGPPNRLQLSATIYLPQRGGSRVGVKGAMQALTAKNPTCSYSPRWKKWAAVDPGRSLETHAKSLKHTGATPNSSVRTIRPSSPPGMETSSAVKSTNYCCISSHFHQLQGVVGWARQNIAAWVIKAPSTLSTLSPWWGKRTLVSSAERESSQGNYKQVWEGGYAQTSFVRSHTHRSAWWRAEDTKKKTPQRKAGAQH